MSEDELNNSLKRDEIKTNSWKRIMKIFRLPLIILIRPKLRENYMHMTKRQKLKANSVSNQIQKNQETTRIKD